MIAEESSIVDSIYFDIFGVTYIIVIGFLYYSGFWSEVHVLTEPSEELKISYQYGVGLVESQKLLETYKCTNGPDVIIVRILYDRPKVS